MSDYRIAVGTNIALASLTVLSPQPSSPGIKATRRLYTSDGNLLEQGPYLELIYNVVEDAAQLSAILTPMGLMAASSAAVTVYARNQLYQYRRYNGIALRPEAGWENYFARNVVIVIRELALST